MEIRERIIDFLIKNRVSSTEVADCLGKTGVLIGLMPITQGLYTAGKVKWIYAYNESNWSVHEGVENLEEESIVIVDSIDCKDRAIFGELVSKYILQISKCRAIVVDGKMRDAAALIKEKWPIWCKGYNPVGCYNWKPKFDVDNEWKKSRFEKYDGAIAVCDDCGVVVIPKEKIDEDFLAELNDIRVQEDIWMDRLDHFNESTFQIVCQKKYLKDNLYMSKRNLK